MDHLEKDVRTDTANHDNAVESQMIELGHVSLETKGNVVGPILEWDSVLPFQFL